MMQNESALRKLLLKAKNAEFACILNSNGFADPYGEYEILAGFGAERLIHRPIDVNPEKLSLGFVSYDYKNQVESLTSHHPGYIVVPDFFFFEPLEVYSLDRTGFENGPMGLINLEELPSESENSNSVIEWSSSIAADVYFQKIETIKKSIVDGDFYELNFCTEWQSDGAKTFDPYNMYIQLCKKAPAPFSAFVKYQDRFLLCSSPERYLNVRGNKIVSQPIKGTRGRVGDHHMDAQLKTDLMTSEKDRAENIMIADLVRNDLSRICIPGTVEVEELCGIHSFSHVHQMISTISGQLQENVDFEQILGATFPMGSMTGAPKIRVMEEIEALEDFKRGWYSGSVGYIDKNKLDLNVVIRSLQYDAQSQRLAYHVGGAITFDSQAAQEFEECKTKAAGMMSALGTQPIN